ncbi:GNAT family N-acetyltransferase [Novosphingobium sp. ES2-1]|uniref:GNAT family N-acetyltransferase n=1 Tax=Novosphingobium sp. ES2-1 TaxID=2780074 RepID=UPI001E351B27|nr:GNAT family N-acetyltransferase [Novosphingobium sp. ES2-1]
MNALPQFETDRLILRVPGRDDYLLLRDLVADPEVHRFLGPRPEDPTTDMFSRALRGAGSWQLYGYGMFLVHEKGSNAFVGQMGLFHSLRGFGKGLDDVVEAGWIVARPFWGRGYAREGMEAALDWFDRTHKPRRIACMIEPENHSSVRLAERLGFVRYDEHIFEDEAAVDLYERVIES